MKKILTALALVTLAASPVLAASKHRTGTDAMAYAANQKVYGNQSAYATGTDPDPFIRNSVQLQLNADQLGNN